MGAVSSDTGATLVNKDLCASEDHLDGGEEAFQDDESGRSRGGES